MTTETETDWKQALADKLADYDEGGSKLAGHARYELRRAGLFDDDSDYGGMLGDAVLALIRVFAAQGHSGMSASLTRQLFAILSDFKPLMPITSDPEEWIDHSAISERPLWQNKRDSTIFSCDGGKTWEGNTGS